MMGLKRILVPTDFSEPSGVALRYAIDLARVFKAQIHLLHVPEHPGKDAETEFPIGLFETMQNNAHDRLGQLLTPADVQDLRPEYAMRIGKPDAEICSYARAHDIDLIVMGTHGRTGVAHVVLGSVAERVVRLAPCPVLTIRHHDEHEFISPAEAAELATHLPA